MKLFLHLFIAVIISAFAQTALAAEEPAVAEEPSPDNKEQVNTQKVDYRPPSIEDFRAAWSGSLMFDSEDLKSLTKAMNEIRLGDQTSVVDAVKDVVNDVKEGVEKKELKYPILSPFFYVNSIIYISDNDWIVYINNQKFISTDANKMLSLIPNLMITRVSEHDVQLQFRTEFLDFVSPGWVQKMRPVRGQSEYKGTDQPVRIVRHRLKNNRYSNPKTLESPADIAFVLEPNQSFSVYDVSIKEGEATPTALRPPVQESIVDKVVP